MEKKQTAVEWLVEQYAGAYGKAVNNVMLMMIERAKEMEKEQIVNAHHEGYRDGVDYKPMTEEQYYNETYKTK